MFATPDHDETIAAGEKALNLSQLEALKNHPGWAVLISWMRKKEDVLLSRIVKDIKRGALPQMEDVKEFQKHAEAFHWVEDAPRKARVAYSKLRKDPS